MKKIFLLFASLFFECQLLTALLFMFVSTLSSHALASDFKYDDLVKLIQDQNVRSIESLLPLLPAQMRSNYSMMHDSESLQSASYEAPRIILFGDDASLTCTFNGDKSQSGFDTFECFQFDKQRKIFDFRQIQFPTEENQLGEVQFSESNLTVNKQVSCTACHSLDPRPNWQEYSRWPGAYGENDDTIDNEELSRYNEFKKSAADHPRYKWLLEQGPASSEYSARPNLRFSDYVGRMNGYRAERILSQKLKDWQVLGFAVSALKCQLNEDQNKRLKDHPYDIQLESLFQQLDIAQNDWTPRIGKTEGQNADYEHQSGFGYLTIEAAMAILKERADRGDTDFKFAFNELTTYVLNQKANDYFFVQLFSILPDPDIFGGAYQQNIAFFCPKLTELFTQSYIESFK